MAVDLRGPKGQPVFLGTSAPATAADLTLLGDEIYKRGTRVVGTTAERNTLVSGGIAYEGLEFYDTTLDRVLTYDGSGWTGFEFIDWTPISLVAGWTATRSADYMVDRNKVYLRGDAGRSNPVAASWTRFGSIPTEAVPVANSLPTFVLDAGAGSLARMQVYDAGLPVPGGLYISSSLGASSNRCSLDGIQWSVR